MSVEEREENEWEDENMEDLFSFGIEEGSNVKINDSPDLNSPDTALITEPVDSSTRDRLGSADSFLEMLGDDLDIDVDGITSNISGGELLNDKETEDILDWLNADDEDDEIEASVKIDLKNENLKEKPAPAVALEANLSIENSSAIKSTPETQDVSSGSEAAGEKKLESLSASLSVPLSTPRSVSKYPPESDQPIAIPEKVSAQVLEELPTKGKDYGTGKQQETEKKLEHSQPAQTELFLENQSITSLEQALNLPDSTTDQIRDFYIREGLNNEELRSELWCKMVCNKTSIELERSSLADSFVKWQREANIDSFDDERSTWLKNECSILAERIAGVTTEEATRDLISILLFNYIGNDSQEFDPLLPPVVCTILSAGIPIGASSVLLSKMMASKMPLLSLTQGERIKASKTLHTEFYLLACYHLPLLVFHLDRHSPGWHWPKRIETEEKKEKDAWRNIEDQGVIPQSWLISHLAGECNGALMNPKWLLSLWDLILTSNNNSLRFFLALAILEKHSDSLLMVSGENLVKELNHILEFKEGTTLEGFAIEAEEETTSSEADDWVREWCARARALYEATPPSVVRKLRKIEDEAVSSFLEERQRKTDAKLEAKLEAESKAHKQAIEAEREKRADENRLLTNRARLVTYYKQYNPGKEGNIEKILETYNGRLDLLDAKLKAKYGQGFNPVMKSNGKTSTSKIFESMNQGFSNSRKRISQALKREEKPNLETVKKHEVTVRVAAREVLPVVCWSKESNSLKKNSSSTLDPLKYYLVDSRPEQTAQEQGRFPTSLSLSPAALLDPDLMKQQEEMFESLRGAVHIVVMGEGFSALPSLYGQKMNPNLSQLIAEDESRADLCALFFVKRGFPFVSLLDGGFCGAHAWLSRHGHKRDLYPKSVLVDYNDSDSMFGQLERVYREQIEFANASASEKTQLAFQGLFDKSLTSLTLSTSRFENLTSGFSGKQASSEVGESTVVNNNDIISSRGADREANSVDKEVLAIEQKKIQDVGENNTTSPNPELLLNRELSVKTKKDVGSLSDEDSEEKKAKDLQQSNESRFGSLGAVFTTLKSNSTGSSSTMSGLGKSEKLQKSFSTGKIFSSSVPSTILRSNTTGNATSGSGNIQEPQEKRFTGIGAAFNKSMKANTSATEKTPPQAQESRFATLGVAFNKTLMMNKSNPTSNPENPTILKRNPFSRFSGRDSKPQQPSRFGMGSLRNPLAATNNSK